MCKEEILYKLKLLGEDIAVFFLCLLPAIIVKAGEKTRCRRRKK